MSFTSWIKQHEKLFYLSYCLKHVNDPYFRKKAITIYHPYNMRNQYYGPNHPDRFFYEIIVGNEGIGFCGIIRDILHYLTFADAMGFEPFISCTDNVAYHEDHPIHGKINAFEYYFEQPCLMDLEELHTCTKVIASDHMHWHSGFQLNGLTYYPNLHYNIRSDDDNMFTKLYRKYFILNPIVEEQLQSDISALIKGRTIGVHYRGTDYKSGFKNHPTFIEPQRHLDETKKLLSTGKYDYVFLATDDDEAIDIFEKELMSRVLFYRDTFRGHDNICSAHKDNERYNHHYNLGYEVLRDLYTLTHCQAFISSFSGVGMTTQIIKKSLDEAFEHQIILHDGLNKKGFHTSKKKKTMLRIARIKSFSKRLTHK